MLKRMMGTDRRAEAGDGKNPSVEEAAGVATRFW